MAILSALIGLAVLLLSLIANIIGIFLFSWPLWYLVIPFVLSVFVTFVVFVIMVIYTRRE